MIATLARRDRMPVVAAVIGGSLALLASCAINRPAGKHASSAITDREEIEIGAQADRELREEISIHQEMPALAAYVAGVGSSLVEVSGRPELSCRFAIVDSPIVDAFALPGGFVYVSRGLLDVINSEDELAAALGHEIAHVAARHGVARISKTHAAPLSTIGPELFTDPRYASQLRRITGMARTLASGGYPPDDEREADDRGAACVARAGYNPRGAIDLLRTLKRLESEDPSRARTWFESHPQTAARIARVEDEAAELERKNPEAFARPIRREEYLRQIDGLALGLFNSDGFVTDNRYVNRPDEFSVEIPAGWEATLGGGERVVVLGSGGDGIRVEIVTQAKIRPGAAPDIARDYLKRALQDRLEPIAEVMKATLPAGEGAVLRFRGFDGQGRPVSVRKLFLVRLDRQLVITWTAPIERTEATEPMFRQFTGLLRYLEPGEISTLPRPRLSLYQAKDGDTWSSIAARLIEEGASGARLAAYNGRQESEGPEPGLVVKVPVKGAG